MTTETTRTGEIVTSVPNAIALQSVDTQTLRRDLTEAIGMTETAIRRVAAIWVELVRRGEDMSGVKFVLAPFMDAIARGALLPKLVIQMAGQTRSLRRLADLSLADQARLADGETLTVVRGDLTRVEKPLKNLSFPELCGVVQGGRILAATEQTQRIASATPRVQRKSTVVALRLAADTYNAATEAAAAAGLPLDDLLRRLIINGLAGRG